MDRLRGKYRYPYQELGVELASNSVVLEQSFVADSLRRNEPVDGGLNPFRGLLNAMIISLAFWLVLGLALFKFL